MPGSSAGNSRVSDDQYNQLRLWWSSTEYPLCDDSYARFSGSNGARVGIAGIDCAWSLFADMDFGRGFDSRRLHH
jgi:hypothetical protein